MCYVPKDEKYYIKYNNIYSLLFRAYMDKYILNSIKDIDSRKPKGANRDMLDATFVLSHNCELAKTDLALTIWKVYYDIGKDANTVKSLNKYLFYKYGVKNKIVETESIKKVRPLICDARRGFIAHNLMENSGGSLRIDDLFSVLDDIRDILNNLCDERFDSRVEPLSYSVLFKMCLNEKGGFENPFMRIYNIDIESD